VSGLWSSSPATALNDHWESEEEDADEGDIDVIDHCERGFLTIISFFSPLCYYITSSGRKKTWRFRRCYSGSSARNGGHKLA
jgi:hypothetical protein